MIFINVKGKKQVVIEPGESEKDILKQMAQAALENNGWNITHAALDLGMQRTTLYERIKKWGMINARHEEQALQAEHHS